MLKLASEILKDHVYSIHSGESLGRLEDFIVQPENLNLIFFEIYQVFKSERLYLRPQDCRHIDKNKIIVNSHQDLGKKSDIIRQKDLLDKQFKLIGATVQTPGKKRLGKVADFSFDNVHFGIAKLYVHPYWFDRLIYSSLIIKKDDIVDIRMPNTIIVRERAAKARQNVFSFLPARS